LFTVNDKVVCGDVGGTVGGAMADNRQRMFTQYKNITTFDNKIHKKRSKKFRVTNEIMN
jgi:hypothetical protein